MGSTDFQGRIKRIQWNNQVISGLMMVYFLVSIFIFVSLMVACFVAVVYVFDPDSVQDVVGNTKTQVKFARLYLKFLGFSFLGAFYFIYRDFNHAEKMFGGNSLDLRSDDMFYQRLENQCISRGLPVPELFVIDDPHNLPPGAVTAVVLQGLSKKSKMLLSPAVYRLPPALQDAFIAQAVARVHTKDVFFFTLPCFLGHFPFHVLRQVNPVGRFVFKPFLKVTDFLMAPVRKLILNMRMAKLDVGSLELTKDKSSTTALLDILTPLETIEKYYYEAYLPLFIAKSDGPYRLQTLAKA